MKTITLLNLILLLVSSVYSQTILWQDEFDDATLDLEKWEYHLGTGSTHGLWMWGNGEEQYYTKVDENIRLEDGLLKITALNESFGICDFTSAKIVTEDLHTFTYGTTIIARIKLPSAHCVWPAFWLLNENNSWPETGEIDIMEAKHSSPSYFGSTLHYQASEYENTGIGYNSGEDLSADFHDYGMIWKEDTLVFTFDGKIVGEINKGTTVEGTWPFNENFYLLLNVAVGGLETWYTGRVEPNTALYPTTMEVDFVRVYEGEVILEPDPLPVPGIVEAEKFLDADKVATEDCEDVGGGANVGYIDAGDWMRYKIDVQIADYYNLHYRYASKNDNRYFFVDIDEARADTIDLNNTGDWQNWETYTVDSVYLSEGVHSILLSTDTGGFNLNYINIVNSWTETSIKEISSKITYSNPIENILIITSDTYIDEIYFYNVSGKLVKVSSIKDNHASIDAADLSPGMYIANLVMGNSRKTIKIIKY